MDDLTTVKEELNSMDLRLNEMEEKMDSIDTKLTQVVEAILGNPLTGEGGFVSKVKKIEDEKIKKLEVEIERLKTVQNVQDGFKNKVTWTFMILVGIAIFIKEIAEFVSNVKGI